VTDCAENDARSVKRQNDVERKKKKERDDAATTRIADLLRLLRPNKEDEVGESSTLSQIF